MFTVSNEEIKTYLQKIDFPKYKINEFLQIRKVKLPYQNINSKQQIKTIINITNTYASVFNRYTSLNIETDLIEVLSKFKDKEYANKVRERINKSFDNDDVIYDFLKTITSKKYSLIHPKDLCNAAEIVAQNIKYFFNVIFSKESKYLDVGAGDGYKTKLIAQNLDIDLKNVHAIDYSSFDDRKYNREKDINFYDLENKKSKLPFMENTFDLISMMMVLHHITDDESLHFTLQEIVRVLKNGGYFLIKEHNCMNVIDCMLSDIEHCMYELVNKKPNYKFRHEKYSRYFNWIELDIILAKYGFEKVKMDSVDYSVSGKINASKHFILLYVLKK